MTHSPVAEQYLPESTLSHSIQQAAEARGISLEQERLNQLVWQAQNIRRTDDPAYGYLSNRVFSDMRNDVSASRAVHSERFDATVATLDFTPILDGDGDLASGAATACPDNVTEVTLMGIHGLQNYALLVDAGIIEKPDMVFGITNPEMAIVAERAGLLSDIARRNKGDSARAHKEMRGMDKVEVYASFDEMGEHAFSQATQKLEQMLARRMATSTPVGAMAVSQ